MKMSDDKTGDDERKAKSKRKQQAVATTFAERVVHEAEQAAANEAAANEEAARRLAALHEELREPAGRGVRVDDELLAVQLAKVQAVATLLAPLMDNTLKLCDRAEEIRRDDMTHIGNAVVIIDKIFEQVCK